MPLAERVPFLQEENKVDSEVMKVLQWLHDCENSEAETAWRDCAQESYKFYAGDQDSEEVKTLLKEMKRPVSVFNEIKPKIDMLCGMAAQTKYDPTVMPRSKEDEPLAELASGALSYYAKKMGVKDKHISCFQHMAKSGRSLLHFYIDKQNPFKPEVKCKRISGFNFRVDSTCNSMDLNEAKYYFIDKWVTEDEMKVFWPQIDTSLIVNHTATGGDYPLFFNEQLDLYRVCECWYKVWVEAVGFVNPMTKQPEVLTREDFKLFIAGLNEVQKETGKPIPEIEPIKTFIEKRRYIIFADIYSLESGYSPYQMQMYPSVLFGAYKNDWTNQWFGAIEAMKDPQIAINTARRQLSHLLQTLPKGFPIHEIGAILNIEEYEERSSDPSFHLEVQKGAVDKVRFEKQPQISPIYQSYDFAMQQSMKDSSGVQDELLGIQKTGREAGVTTRTRQEAAIAVLYILFDNFRRGRLQSSEILLKLIQQYKSQADVIRIEGQEGMMLMEINSQLNPQNQGFNDISGGNFDLEVDESLENTTMRMTIAQLLTDFSHNNPDSIPPEIVLDYANLPWTVKQKVGEFWRMQQELAQKNIEEDRKMEYAKIAASKANKSDSKKED